MRLAVLIDAENISARAIGEVLAEVGRLGTACIKRAYGDFTNESLSGWRAALSEFGIQPVQQFCNTGSKNASDFALVIDAMDLLRMRELDGFCLVSSDSDFTRLAMRIREDGYKVYGFGEAKTPASFRQACDKFVDIPGRRMAAGTGSAEIGEVVGGFNIAGFDSLLERALELPLKQNRRVRLSVVGKYLRQAQREFDGRKYGHRKLSSLLRKSRSFSVVEETSTKGDKVHYVERK